MVMAPLPDTDGQHRPEGLDDGEPSDPVPEADTGVERPLLSIGEFTVHLDHYAWEIDPDNPRHMRLWTVSMNGPQNAARAAWARLLKGEVGYLKPNPQAYGRQCTLASLGAGGFESTGLPLHTAAGYHLLLLPAAARFDSEREEFVLVIRRPGCGIPGTPPAGDNPAEWHLRYLNRRVDVGLHPSWAGWLWARALRRREAIPLEAYGDIEVYRCTPDPQGLEEDLSGAVRARLLTIPEPGDRAMADVLVEARGGAMDPAAGNGRVDFDPALSLPADRRARLAATLEETLARLEREHGGARPVTRVVVERMVTAPRTGGANPTCRGALEPDRTDGTGRSSTARLRFDGEARADERWAIESLTELWLRAYTGGRNAAA